MLNRFLNTVIEGDALKVMRRIPDASIDMILCDLPYGITQNKWDEVIDFKQLWLQYERIIKSNGAIVLNAQGIFTARLITSNEKLFKYKLTWVKSKSTNFLNAKKQPLRKHEDICVFYKKQPAYNPQWITGKPYNRGVRKKTTGSYGEFAPALIQCTTGKRYPTDVIHFNTAECEGKVWHPTQKPVALGRHLIRTFTHHGAIVLDNACGSSSYLVAACLEGRNFIGIEKNEATESFIQDRIDFVEISRQRVQEAALMNKHSS